MEASCCETCRNYVYDEDYEYYVCDMDLDEEMDLFKEQISEELKKMNDRLTNKNINLEFKMHQRTHRIYVEMVDKTTKKVVKEIPSKKMLDMIGRIWDEMGIAVDKKG